MPSTPTAPPLSVVVPTRNESGNVEPLVQRLALVLRGVATEVIFVDDSNDDTPVVLAALAADPPPGIAIRVVHRPESRQTGLGSAATEGLAMASGDLVAVMDGDLQHPPELLTRMIRALERDDLDLVVASRYTAGGSARGLNGPARVAVSWASKIVAQVLFREARKTSDPLSGYFLCRRAAIEGLEFRPIGFKVLLEVLVCAASARVGDVPLSFAERHAGRSNASMAQGVAFLRHLWSLLVHVPGSARVWKYATVGAGGLAIFLAVLAVSARFGVGPLGAWSLAFLASLLVNWQLNRLVTFADVASRVSRRRPLYLPFALIGGVGNLATFTALVAAHTELLAAGMGGALVAAAVNYAVQRGVLRRPPRVQGPPSAHRRALATEAGGLVAARGGVVPLPVDDASLEAVGPEVAGTPPRELLRAAETRKALLLAEAPSHKPQARTDVGVSAWMAVPIMDGGRFNGLLVLHRDGRPFGGDELDIVLRVLQTHSGAATRSITPLLTADRTGSG